MQPPDPPASRLLSTVGAKGEPPRTLTAPFVQPRTIVGTTCQTDSRHIRPTADRQPPVGCPSFDARRVLWPLLANANLSRNRNRHRVASPRGGPHGDFQMVIDLLEVQ